MHDPHVIIEPNKANHIKHIIVTLVSTYTCTYIYRTCVKCQKNKLCQRSGLGGTNCTAVCALANCLAEKRQKH